MPHNCCVPFCNTTSKKNKTLRFHRFPKKKDRKEQWICKIRRDDGEYFTVTGNTCVSSRHFHKEDYIISEDGKGKRTVLRKGAVPSVFQWAARKRSRSTLGAENVVNAAKENVLSSTNWKLIFKTKMRNLKTLRKTSSIWKRRSKTDCRKLPVPPWEINTCVFLLKTFATKTN